MSPDGGRRNRRTPPRSVKMSRTALIRRADRPPDAGPASGAAAAGGQAERHPRERLGGRARRPEPVGLRDLEQPRDGLRRADHAERRSGVGANEGNADRPRTSAGRLRRGAADTTERARRRARTSADGSSRAATVSAASVESPTSPISGDRCRPDTRISVFGHGAELRDPLTELDERFPADVVRHSPRDECFDDRPSCFGDPEPAEAARGGGPNPSFGIASAPSSSGATSGMPCLPAGKPRPAPARRERRSRSAPACAALSRK